MNTPIKGPVPNSTPLAVVARRGNLRGCEALLNGGATVSANDLEIVRDYPDILELFRNRENILETRGGSGDAFHRAMIDSNAIIQVSWYAISLGGLAGIAGAVHSLLVVQVGLDASKGFQFDASVHVGESYVIEKCNDDGRITPSY